MNGVLTMDFSYLFYIFPEHIELVVALIDRPSIVENCIEENAKGEHIRGCVACHTKGKLWW